MKTIMTLINQSVAHKHIVPHIVSEDNKKSFILIQALLLLVCSIVSMSSFAAGVTTMEPIEVRANTTKLLGVANSPNEGTVLKEQLDRRTVYRPGELMETVPGLVVTQHSGEGKANQYFMRGFNLDHGTDVRIVVNGMLVNKRSHGHGQGWADTNFIIPELIGSLRYQKGPYYADQGDFSSAGAVQMDYVNRLPTGIASFTGGDQGYFRGMAAKSHEVGAGDFLYAIELLRKDGPWVNKERFNKFNAVLRYSQNTGTTKFNVTAMGYGGRWNATDHIPRRAVRSGRLGRLDTIDPSDGGEMHRFSISSGLEHHSRFGLTKVNLYTLHTNLDLFSNFTYFLDDPVNGDQFSQFDERFQTGFDVSHAWVNEIAGFAFENKIGFQYQNDVINNGLLKTRQRRTLSTTRRDNIWQNSVGLYYENSVQWLEKLRTVTGVRSDFYWFDVNSNLDINSGKSYDSMTNPKLAVILGPWFETEFYFNYGSSFHSNDARGTTTVVDPGSGDIIDPVNPLVRATGFETGFRTAIVPGLQASLAFFRLELDSELIFVGDAGTTEASRPSVREGIEVSAFYKPTDWLTIDADYAIAKARFSDSDPAGRFIPQAVRDVGKVAASFDNVGPFFGGMQFRYFGRRALNEDNSARSDPTFTLNGQLGYKLTKKIRFLVQAFNILGSRDHAIDYFYASRLPGEAAEGVEDVHFHPIETRSMRASIIAHF